MDVPEIEGMKEVERQHRHEPEVQDRSGRVLVDVIGVPLVDGFVESLVFDVPSRVTESYDRLMGDPVL